MTIRRLRHETVAVPRRPGAHDEPGSDREPERGAAPGGRRFGRLLAALIVADIGFAYQQTAIVPAVQTVRTSLHASQEWAAWLVTVYLVVATVATPAMGRLGDLHGRRRMLVAGLAVFAAGSVGAAVAPNIAVLIVFRAIQGVGGAVYPLTLAVARDAAPKRRAGLAISLLAGSFGAGTAIGFVTGGYLAQDLSWRWIFAVGAVLVVLGALAVIGAVPATKPTAEGRFDLRGAALLSAAAGCTLVALTLVVRMGWSDPVVVALLALAVAATAAWTVSERRTRDPLLDLNTLRIWTVLRAHLGAVSLGWALFGVYLLVPRFAQADGVAGSGYGLELRSAGVGLLMLPLAIGQTAAAPAAGWLSGRVGNRSVFSGGLIVLVAALTGLCLVHRSAGAVAALLLLFGVGAGAALESGSAAAAGGVDEEVAAASSAFNSTVRRFAGGIGGQVATILLASLALGPGSGTASFTAFRVAYVVAAALCLIGAALGIYGGAES